MGLPDPIRTIEAVWRIESAKVIATVARMTGDIGLAEESAQDAFLLAVETWPHEGVPENPGGWLTTTAKRKAIDQLRRQGVYEEKLRELAQQPPARPEPELLTLIFTACHPDVAVEGRLALTLRLLGGLTTAEIARAFLVPEPTVGQRIYRAKAALRKVPIELPPAEELPARLASVLEVIYLIFNEGYSATSGDSWTRNDLCFEALRLSRVLAALMPTSSEASGLQALLEIQSSRLNARIGPGGEPVLLADQDRTRWDRLLIRRGLEALTRAESTGVLGPYGLQAAIAAVHARAGVFADTDWARMAALYQLLAHVAPSPIVELNRAVAVGMAEGPEAGLKIVDGLPLEGNPHLSAVRGDLLERSGRVEEARAAFLKAAELTRNVQEKALYEQRARA
ncbi:RNA polymerase sigma factor [Herbidospora mongoliensis]|uniref:RNA polymerase sigma factor n=1 Tax=Herbidospora mongoliensis TaxID=688067 RepID=UPI00083490AF|nr:DUF6596 domain-containing protein [Herbidospora mongoliensis]